MTTTTTTSLSTTTTASDYGTVTIAGHAIGFAVNKAGTGILIPSKKWLGERTGLKGGALTRAHNTLRLEGGKVLNAKMADAYAKGLVLTRGIIPTKNGGTVKFDWTSRVKDPAPKAGTAAAAAAAAAEEAAKAKAAQAAAEAKLAAILSKFGITAEELAKLA